MPSRARERLPLYTHLFETHPHWTKWDILLIRHAWDCAKEHNLQHKKHTTSATKSEVGRPIWSERARKIKLIPWIHLARTESLLLTDCIAQEIPVPVLTGEYVGICSTDNVIPRIHASHFDGLSPRRSGAGWKIGGRIQQMLFPHISTSSACFQPHALSPTCPS